MNTADSLHDVLRNRHVRQKLFDAGYFFGDLVNRVGTISRPLKNIGVTNEEMRSDAFQDRIHPEDRPNYMRLWHRLNHGLTDELYCEYRVESGDGSLHWIETHAVVVERSGNGGIAKVIGFDRLIDTRKQSEELLTAKHQEASRKLEINEAMRRIGANITLDRDLQNMLRTAAEELSGVIRFDCIEFVTLNRDEINRVYGASTDESPEVESDEEALRVFRDMLEDSHYPIIVDRASNACAEGALLLVPLRVHNGFVGMVLIWRHDGAPFSGDDLYPVMALTDSLACTVYDRSYYRETVARLERDGLTGLLTRSAFDREVPSLWAEYERLYSSNSVAILDIDRFKNINDTYGHAAGDKVLRELAQLMRDGLRQEDILVRYGGEEFVVIFPNTQLNTAAHIIDRLRYNCSTSTAFDLPVPVHFSAGVCERDEANPDLKSILASADSRLYHAKRSGRNRVCPSPS